MLRTGMSFGVVVLVLLSSVGCQSCRHTYDNSGPVFSDHKCPTCGVQAREGSILDGSTPLTPLAPDATQAKEAKKVDKTKFGKVSGSEKIISVKDRVVKPGKTTEEPPQLAVESVTESSKPLPSKEWTARRPTAELVR
jgi:hypothetical protein